MQSIRTAPRRVDWQNADDLEAMVLAAFGFSPQVIARETGLTHAQVTYRCGKAGIKCTDYRFRRAGTLGREVATSLLHETKRRYTNVVRGRLQEEPPTKRRARALQLAGANGNGRY
jgi:hypothetical protein